MFFFIVEKAGYNVLGIDINKEYVKSLNNKLYSSNEPNVEKYLKDSKNFRASTDLDSNINFSKNIYIMVNTPETELEYYDTFILDDILKKISKLAKEPKHVIISCTVQPGYLSNKASKILNNNHINHMLSYNPEIVRIGNVIYDIENNNHPIIIGSNNENNSKFIENIYKNIYKYSNINKK